MRQLTVPAPRARPRGQAGPASAHDRTSRQLGLPFDAVTHGPVPGPGLPGPPRSVPPVPSPPALPPPVEPGARSPVVHYVRHQRARRYVLRVLPDGSVRVTIPRGGSRREAESFAARHQEWVERQRRRLRRGFHDSGPLRDGDAVLVHGRPERIAVRPTEAGLHVTVGPADLIVATASDVRTIVTRALRRLAERELPPRLLELAAGHGLRVGNVSVRDQRGRWGSCAVSGNISLNWRLVQMPPEVRDYVLLHELMHLREPNHSHRFWRLVHDACPWHLSARRWLAREGRTLL